MNKKKSVPSAAMRLSDGGVELLVQEGNGPRRLRMIGNSGRPILGHWFWGTLAIDLSGINIGRQKRPVLCEHDNERKAGYTDKIYIADEGVVAEGVFLNNDEAKEVIQLLDDGYPWEASIHIPALSIEEVAAGSTAKVNGYALPGPATIFRKSELRELSFCTLGADQHTSAVALTVGADVINVEVIGVLDMELDKLTVKILEKDRPDLVEQIEAKLTKSITASAEKEKGEQLKAARQEGIDAERKRAVSIAQEANKFGLPEQVSKLIAEGVDEIGALMRLKDARIEALQKGTPSSPGPSNDQESESLSVEDKHEKEWSKSAELRTEFLNDKDVYLSYCKAKDEGRAKIHGVD